MSIGIAVGLHAMLGLVHVARGGVPQIQRLIHQADFVEVEAVEQPVPEPLAQPEPPRPLVRRESPVEEPPVEQPPPNPAVGAVVPDEVVPTPQVEVANSTEGGLAVNAAVGDGNGLGSGSGTRHDGPAVEGTPVANLTQAAPHDPRPAQRAYLRQLQGVVGRPRYTNGMRRRGIEGTVLIGVTIDPAGHASAVRVKRSSGDAELDAMVLEHVRGHVGSLPAPSAETEWHTREVSLPYQFDLDED